MDTICAVSTAPGRAGVAIVRVSGPHAVAAARQLAGNLPEPGRHAVRKLRFEDGAIIDEALVLNFAAPASFTGEDVVEFQTHGSPAVTSAVVDALEDLGVRRAEPGEFTRRALENDRLDLVAVEGLSDLLAAETRAQLDQAQSVLAGELAETVEFLHSHLLRAAALFEAMIDFADEDVPEDVTDEAVRHLDLAQERISLEIAGSFVAERVRDGFEVAVLGAPNTGKSTLLNALAGRQAALVSDMPGTTRDVIEFRQDLRGLPVTWLDTAGLRDASDAVERMGIDLARQRAEQADLRVFLLSSFGEAVPLAPLEDDLVLVGKADLQDGDVSGVTGKGIDRLLDHVHEVLSRRVAKVGGATAARHRLGFELAAGSLSEARAEALQGLDRIDIAAEYIRAAVRNLEGLVGRMDVESVLGEIFSSFCIGK